MKPKGRIAGIDFCKSKTHDKRFPYPSHQCYAKIWKDGHCKRHHPDEVRRRRKERDDKREKLFENRYQLLTPLKEEQG